MDMHDGSIAADSEGVGRGTTFTVRLPAAPGLSSAASTSGAAAGPNGEARRILVVDDNIDAAETLSMLLESLGHDIRTAHTGPAALQTALEFGPDLVLLDIGLPGLSGYEVARRFRGHEKLASAMLVAVTGWGSDEDRRKASEAGFDVHLTKPIEMNAIESVLAKAATRHVS